MEANLRVGAAVTLNAAVVQPLVNGLTAGSSDAVYLNTARWSGIESVKAGSQTVNDNDWTLHLKVRA